MAGTWKTVRVFISSTFRDMHAERDHLVKVVFPRLREWCEARRLHLIDIDLRWGVTKEEADNGKAIDLCLEEIDGSRPFFVCLLGSRYGCVPDELPPEDVYRFQGLQATTHCSITHLEVVHAIGRPIIERLQPLKQGVEPPSPCPHAFFFFRRERCLPLPEDAFPGDRAMQQRYREMFFESPPKADSLDRRQQLVDLKAAIRGAVPAAQIVEYEGKFDPQADNPEDDEFPHGRLVDLERFGASVYKQLQRAIRRHFAEHLRSLGHRDALADEQAYHDALIENRTQVHVPRSDIEQRLDEYAGGDDPRPLVLTGEPGSGKTAILAHWVDGRGIPASGKRADEFLLARFIGASPSSVTLARLLGNICAQLQRQFALEEEVTEEVETAPGQKEKQTRVQPMEVPTDPDEVLRKWPKFLQAVSGKGRVVLVIDALNQLDNSTDATRLYWFPRKLPPGVRLIASVLNHGERSRAEHQPPAGEKPDWLSVLRRLEVHEVQVPDLSDAERRQIVRELPSVFCKTLDDEQLRLLLANPATRNPLYLTVALEELRVFGSFEKLPGRIAVLPAAGDKEVNKTGEDETGAGRAIEDLFGQVLDRLDREAAARKAPGLVSTIFRLLASAKEGLSERELRDLLARLLPDWPERLRAGELQVVLRQVRRYLMRKAHPQGTLVDFYHRSFWKAVQAKYLPQARLRHDTHRELADYFDGQDYFLESIENQRERMKPPYSARPVNTRKTSELPWQLFQVAGEAKARDLLTDLEQVHTRIANLFQTLDFLEGKNEAGLVFELPLDFRRALAELPENYPPRQILKLLDEAVRREIHFIDRHRDDYPQALFQCLWNDGWWYDCPDAAMHYEEADEGRCEPPPWERPGPKLHKLLESWRAAREQLLAGFAWLRSHRPPPVPLGSALLAILRGHVQRVNCVAFSPEGLRIVSASGTPFARCDNTMRIWGADSGAELACLSGHDLEVNSVAFSPNGRRLVSGSDDKTVRVWDATSGAELACFRKHEDRVMSVAFSPDGRRIVSGSWDNTLRVWDATSGAELSCFRKHESRVASVAFSPDGRRIASGYWDTTVRVWDADSSAQVSLFRGHERCVMSVAFSPDGRRIASGAYDSTLRVWDADSGAQLACLRLSEDTSLAFSVDSVAFSPDGRRIATGSGDGTVRVWDTDGGAQLALFRGHEDWVTSVVYSPDGRRIVSGSRDKTVRMWEADGGTELPALRGHKGWVAGVIFSPRGQRVASVAFDGTTRNWDAESGVELNVISGWSDLVPAQSDLKFQYYLAEQSSRTVMIQRATSGQPVAWYDAPFSTMATHPCGPRWAGSAGHHLYLITLEGDGSITSNDGYVMIREGNLEH